MSSLTLPPPEGPEYTPCGCGHIEPEHEPDAGECYSCDCTAYRPLASAAVPAVSADRAADCPQCDDTGACNGGPCPLAPAPSVSAASAPSVAGVRAAALTEAAEVAASRGGCPCNTAETIAHLLRCLAAEAHDGDTQAVPVCVCGHPMHQHHEDVCLTDCGCNDGREPEEPTDLPGRLAAALTARFTELGNPFSQMRYHEQGPDGWPASHPVGPNRVADVLRELMPAASAVPLVGSAEPDSDETGPRTVCICGHTRAEHIAVSGRLLCDACDPDSTENLVCRGFDAL